jgi:hypothetical protein
MRGKSRTCKSGAQKRKSKADSELGAAKSSNSNNFFSKKLTGGIVEKLDFHNDDADRSPKMTMGGIRVSKRKLHAYYYICLIGIHKNGC